MLYLKWKKEESLSLWVNCLRLFFLSSPVRCYFVFNNWTLLSSWSAWSVFTLSTKAMLQYNFSMLFSSVLCILSCFSDDHSYKEWLLQLSHASCRLKLICLSIIVWTLGTAVHENPKSIAMKYSHHPVWHLNPSHSHYDHNFPHMVFWPNINSTFARCTTVTWLAEQITLSC